VGLSGARITASVIDMMILSWYKSIRDQYPVLNPL
jgi:hypothetical protein